MKELITKSHDLSIDLAGPATWSRVRHWSDLSAKLSHALVATQVMAGFDLIDLRKENNIKPGNPNFKAQLPNDSVIANKSNFKAQLPNDLVIASKSWAELVAEHAGISDETARNWMRMAEGVKSRWRKLDPKSRLAQLMSVPPSEWSEDDTQFVFDAVQKATDGQSQIDFMRELGLAKKPSGNPNAKGGGRRALSIAEQAEAEKLLVEEVMKRITEDLTILGGRFTIREDGPNEAFSGALMKSSQAINAWLKQPKNNRNAQAIHKLFDK